MEPKKGDKPKLVEAIVRPHNTYGNAHGGDVVMVPEPELTIAAHALERREDRDKREAESKARQQAQQASKVEQIEALRQGERERLRQMREAQAETDKRVLKEAMARAVGSAGSIDGPGLEREKRNVEREARAAG